MGKQFLREKKVLVSLVLVLLMISGVFAGVVIQQSKNSTDTRSSASVANGVKLAFLPQTSDPSVMRVKPLSGVSSVSSSEGTGNIAVANTFYPVLKLTVPVSSVGAPLTAASKIRIVYPVTAAGIDQYGWTMSKPSVGNISAKSRSGVSLTPSVGDLNNNNFFGVYYFDLKPAAGITMADSIEITIKNVTTQSISVNNNPIQIFADKLGNNNFVKFADVLFHVMSKAADSVKIFVDPQYTPGQGVRVNATPIYSYDVYQRDSTGEILYDYGWVPKIKYRYPLNDELYSGAVSLRVGSGSTTQVIWPDGSSSATKPEYTFNIAPQSGCLRNCTTSIQSVRPAGQGYFYLEGKVAGKNFDVSFGKSNMSSSNFLADTGLAGKKLYFGDWHSHYTDNNSNLVDDVNFGKLGYKADFVGATNKTSYEYYPQNKQITAADFNAYLAQNRTLEQPGQFLALPNEEWPKVISQYNPFRSTLESNPTGTSSVAANWIHQMILFRSEDRTGFYSSESAEYANFFTVMQKARELNAVVAPHHMGIYPSPFYDSDVQAAARVVGFNGWDAGDQNRGMENFLVQGAKMGFVGESDSHQGTAAEGGVTGIYLDSLSRDTLLDSVKRRDTYASSSFGRPELYFAMTSPTKVEMGKEGQVAVGTKPTFRIKVLMSTPVNQVVIKRGSYGSPIIKKTLVFGTDNANDDIQPAPAGSVKCTNQNNLYMDCTFTETDADNYNFYYLAVGSHYGCNVTWYSYTNEVCAFSSPIWITRSDVNFIYGDSFNNVGEQGKEALLKTRFLVQPGHAAAEVKNLALMLTNNYPTKDLTLNSFKKSTNVSSQANNNWYQTLVNDNGMIVDFKVRNINGQWVFAGLNYQKLLGGRCNYLDDSCMQVFAKPGENKILYLYTDGTYSYSKTSCNPGNMSRCTYAMLNAAKSTISVNKYPAFTADVLDVSWDIQFEPVIGERIYELYTTAFTKDGRAQGWRRGGAVLANPTIPSGAFKVVSANSDANGMVSLTPASPLNDNAAGIEGIGNIYFTVADVSASAPCSFLNEDWYSTNALYKLPNATFQYRLKGERGPRKLCYYLKDAYGLQSQTFEIPVNKTN